MPLLSVITPVYQPVAEHLREAYESLKSQTLPNGWEWEWVVQEDGETRVAHQILPNDPQIKFGSGRRGGVALTRNLALGRSRGTLVKNLDADDVLTPGALARDIEAFQRDPEIRWTTSRVLDLLPDGSTVGFDADPAEGRLEPGKVLRHWRENNYRLPVHPTTICIDRDLLVTLGGWMGIPASEDTGLLLAASSVSVGHFISEVGLYYRKWHGQATANDAHHDETERDVRMRLIGERADVLHQRWGR
ncbi:glycosyltransferase family 2 protein [Haloechinothrix salitolerans]|uniref:Glycosyltransferase family 2 protein n=1 Tax=Haloechinothrix salitolerans TaxID=926830 RepID=A0ABW2BSJ1_9PSEU